MGMPSRDKKAFAWVAVVWAAIVVVTAFLQADVLRALILGLVQEAILLGVALLIWSRRGRKSAFVNDRARAYRRSQAAATVSHR